jgi:predicted AlkP superfamily phosphohydrolase/phosphomutase
VDPNPSSWYSDIRELCLEYYRQLDRNIERMVKAAGPDTNVIMTSDHGFGATTEVVYINEWLARKGYLKWADSAELDETGKLTANKMKDHLGMINWKETVAFCPTPSSNAIYIKKAKGDGPGIKSNEYLDFCLKLRQELLDYRDPANNESVFMGVDLNKLEGTPYVEPSPDLTLRIRDGGFVSILKSSAVVTERKHADGTHRPNGIFIGKGPDIKNGGEQIAPLKIVDITPLMLHLVELPVPKNLEGRVPTELLNNISLEKRQVVEKGVTETQSLGTKKANQAEPTEEEREALLQQMKLLGYMD